MSWLKPFTSKPSVGLQRYLAVRERMSLLMSACAASLLPEEVVATAKKLGLRHRIDPDDELVLVQVYEAAAFHYRRRGETGIARALRNLPADASVLDHQILEGCLRCRWSIYEVVCIHSHEGGDLRDTHDGTVLRVWDEGLASEMKAGEHVAIRLVPIGDLWVTSGPGIVGPRITLAEATRHCLPPAWHDPANWPAQGTPEHDDLILTLMRGNRPHGEDEGFSAPIGVAAPSLTGEPTRKAPCPCGSGKKYKHCCGKGT